MSKLSVIRSPSVDKHGLLTLPISHVLPRLTLPMVFGMVAILLFNVVDTFFVSMLGTQALAAISFTFPVTFGLNCLIMGIGIGMSAHISREWGKKRTFVAARLTTHGLLLAVSFMIIMAGIGYVTLEPLFRLLGASPELIHLITPYMEIWYLAIPLLVIPMAGNSAIRATGDTKTPAKIMMFSAVVNGILDPLFIFGYGGFPALGMKGAAIATAISWLLALFGSLYILIKREHLLIFPQWSYLIDDCRHILQVALPAGLSNALNPISGALLMAILARQSTDSVAAYGAAMRIESLLLIVMIALSSALMPFMAQNIGAKQTPRAFKGLFSAIHFALGFQLLIYIMMIPLSRPLSALFSHDPNVQHYIWQYLIVVPLAYGLQATTMLLMSALNALHRSQLALSWNFLRLFLLLLPMAWLSSFWWGTKGVFISILLINLFCGCAAYAYARYLQNQYRLKFQS